MIFTPLRPFFIVIPAEAGLRMVIPAEAGLRIVIPAKAGIHLDLRSALAFLIVIPAEAGIQLLALCSSPEAKLPLASGERVTFFACAACAKKETEERRALRAGVGGILPHKSERRCAKPSVS